MLPLSKPDLTFCITCGFCLLPARMDRSDEQVFFFIKSTKLPKDSRKGWVCLNERRMNLIIEVGVDCHRWQFFSLTLLWKLLIFCKFSYEHINAFIRLSPDEHLEGMSNQH